jgi:hypothetical protein
LGGRYSSYSSSEYLEQVVHTLERPEVGQIISELLLENDVLYKFQKYKEKILYYLIRLCREEKLWNIVKDLEFANTEISKKNPKVIEAFLNKIKDIPEGDIESEAEKATQNFLITRKMGNNNNFFIYVIAGVISLANIF